MKKIFTILITLLFTCILQQKAVAHAGHDHAPGEDSTETGGPISVSPEAEKNLKLQVEEAQVRTLEKIVTVLGQIEPIPSKSLAVTSRISGRILRLFVNEGQGIKEGDPLIEIESRLVGDPPPRVTYKSPQSGFITDRHVVPGDTVEPDKHLLEVVDSSEVYAEGKLFEGQLSQIKIGQKARIRVEAYTDKSYEGVVELLSGSLDPETRTLGVFVRIKNNSLELKPNMRATMNIVVGEADTSVSIPKSAVLGESGNYFVFVQSDEDEHTFERHAVVTGIQDDKFIEIIEGVFPGDKVVTVGNYQLQYVAPKKTADDPKK